MSKLFRLKQWLTISEAARHLSTIFQELVSEADVLRLALDRRLTISVNFVNHAKARRGQVVPKADARWREVLPFVVEHLVRKGGDVRTPVYVLEGIQIDEEHVLELEEEVVTLDGVYDLPLIGAEALDVENECQRLNGGPSVTLINLQGVFVQESDQVMYQLVERLDCQDMCRALLELDTEAGKEAASMLPPAPKEDPFIPAGELPHDAVLVVRTEALRALLERVEAESEGDEPELDTRAETTYRRLIGALVQLMLGTSPLGASKPVFENKAAIVDTLLASFGNKRGFSKRTIDQKFAEAMRSLEED